MRRTPRVALIEIKVLEPAIGNGAAGSWAIVADRDRGQRGPERMVSIHKRFPASAATPAAVDIIGKPGAG
jgi:hypothetical protein